MVPLHHCCLVPLEQVPQHMGGEKSQKLCTSDAGSQAEPTRKIVAVDISYRQLRLGFLRYMAARAEGFSAFQSSSISEGNSTSGLIIQTETNHTQYSDSNCLY